jgi:ABC-2 type transport system ATP-binding protein
MVSISNYNPAEKCGMEPVIEIQNLCKTFDGRPAVRNLTLAVNQGEVFGFIGPNGAGKTSTIRMMTTLLKPSSGEIRIAGNSVANNPKQIRSKIGYMPDFFGVYRDLKVWEYLDFFASCYEIPLERRQNLVSELLELVDLEHRQEDMVDELSRGMKQRLSLARTLLHDPEVLILDEPASGLDPRARVEIRELLVEMSRMGKTIFFSTHILSDVAEICTQIGIIEAGELVATGSLDELQGALKTIRNLRVSFLGEVDKGLELLREAPGVRHIVNSKQAGITNRSNVDIQFSGTDEDTSALLRLLIQNGIKVVAFEESGDSIEEVFMKLTRGTVS